ncbi:hypothetical protein JYT17_00130 [Nitrospira defluvii]|nr:hypothetical protein [Nitrospira defluvii]
MQIKKQNTVINNKKGLSLIETLLSIAIIVAVSASFYQLLGSFYQNYTLQEAIAETQQQSRVTTDLFWQEIRNAGLDPTGTLFDPANARQTKNRNVFNGVACQRTQHNVERVFEATPTMFHFLADLNGNGEVDGGNAGNPQNDPQEHIRYEWIGDSAADNKVGTDPDACGTERTSYTLYRDSGGGMHPVASNIIEFDLNYYDEDGIQLPEVTLNAAQRTQIRRVVITLVAQTKQALQGETRKREMQTQIFLRNL